MLPCVHTPRHAHASPHRAALSASPPLYPPTHPLCPSTRQVEDKEILDLLATSVSAKSSKKKKDKKAEAPAS